MSTKKQLLLRTKQNIEANDALTERESHARYLANGLLNSSEWLQKRKITYLSVFLEFKFVREALMQLYKDTSNREIKKMIKELHDGTFDNAELLAEIDTIRKDLQAQNRSFDEEHLEIKKSNNQKFEVNVLLKRNSIEYNSI